MNQQRFSTIVVVHHVVCTFSTLACCVRDFVRTDALALVSFPVCCRTLTPLAPDWGRVPYSQGVEPICFPFPHLPCYLDMEYRIVR